MKILGFDTIFFSINHGKKILDVPLIRDNETCYIVKEPKIYKTKKP